MIKGRGLKMFQQGMAETLNYEPTKILDRSKNVREFPAEDLDTAMVMSDLLFEAGVDVDVIREHLKPTGANLVTIGRLVATKGLLNIDYMVLKKDNSLRGKRNEFTFYDADTVVDVWTGEMTHAVFFAQQGGRPDTSKIQRVRTPLREIEPSDWSWSATTVITEEALKKYGFDSSAWQTVYSWALPENMTIPDLSMFLPESPEDRQLELF